MNHMTAYSSSSFTFRVLGANRRPTGGQQTTKPEVLKSQNCRALTAYDIQLVQVMLTGTGSACKCYNHMSNAQAAREATRSVPSASMCS